MQKQPVQRSSCFRLGVYGLLRNAGRGIRKHGLVPTQSEPCLQLANLGIGPRRRAFPVTYGQKAGLHLGLY